MTKKKKTKAKTTASLAQYLTPEIEKILRRPDAVYLGVCIMQAPARWTRLGPTWQVPGHGFCTIGQGLKEWGTTEGLGEIATSTAPTPTYHAAAAAYCQDPNIIYAVIPSVVEHLGLTAMHEEAKNLCAI